MKPLQIGTKIPSGARFDLPPELVTTSLAILAKKRVGKSYTAAIFAEEMMKQAIPVCIIDVTGAHWGLKSSADGKSAGFPVVVFGGSHADVPLEEHAGAVIARAIVEQRFSSILDFSTMSRAGMQRFLQAFLEEFYRLNTEPIHLICDEADRYAPQQPQGDQIKLVAAMDDIVSRGGIKGIGVSIISQRSAKVNKNVVTQCELLVALQIIHHLDIKTIMEWVEVHADKKTADEMLKSMPTLKKGEGWFWWPGAQHGDIFQRVKVRPRETFDSGATPKVGEIRRLPKVLAKVDILKLGADIAATAERMKSDSPRELKTKISHLQGEIARLESASKIKTQIPAKVEIKEVPVFSEKEQHAIQKLEMTTRDLAAKADQLWHKAREFETLARQRVDTSKIIVNKTRSVGCSFGQALHKAEKQALAAINRAAVKPRTVAAANVVLDHALGPPKNGDYAPLAPGEKAVLIACVQSGNSATRVALTVMTGYKKSSRDTYVARLSQKGYVSSVGGAVVITEAGRLQLGHDYEPMPAGAELLKYWLNKLPSGEAKVLQVVVDGHPFACHRDEITEKTGFKKSSRDTYISRLAARKLVKSEAGHVKASDILFDQ